MTPGRDIEFTVPLIPTPKGRPRVGKVGNFARVFTDAKTRRAEEEFVALAAPHAPEKPLDGPLSVTLHFRLPAPQRVPSWRLAATMAGLVWPEKRPDLDNLVKLVLDALNRSGCFWRDDAQVCAVKAHKTYTGVRAERPGTYVKIGMFQHVDSAAEWRAWQGEAPGRESA